MSDLKNVLSRVQKVEPSAYIGGGALRDHLNNRRIKDIDIFVPETANLDKIEKLFVAAGTHKLTKTTKSSDYFDFADPTVVEAREYSPLYTGLPINIIAMRETHFPIEVNMNRFDFGLCRIAFDGDTIITTPEYEHDRDNEVLTLRRCENQTQLDRSMERYERFRNKYDWPMVIPEELNKWAA
jgi:hypothetical protein